MAYTVIMQDWTSVQGPAGVPAIQPEREWLNVVGVQDAVLYVFFARFTGANLVFSLESAPVKEETFFFPVVALTASPLVSMTSANVFVARYASATLAQPPLSAWLRWHLEGATTQPWTATFRIIASLNPNAVGLHAGGMAAVGTALATPARGASAGLNSLVTKGTLGREQGHGDH